ncbi:MAG: aldo/keto reductase [Polaromonas sp.]|jgi:predicted oxidoreductase|nr:aldo/keto reductase [Polaromonas sp.]
MTMPRVELNSDLSLSRLAYGVWRLSEAADTSVPAVAARIQACLDQGITTFDHADIYGGYSCEALFGAALRAQPGLKARMEIVTKCDIMLLSDQRPDNRVKHYDTSSAHVQASVERSLHNIGVDTIDLLLIHRPDPLMDHHALGACLDGLIQSGKVRAAGVSNFMPWDLDLLQSAMKNRLLTNQIEISLMQTRGFVDGQIAHAQRLGLPVMAWSPLGGGRLFGQEAAALRLRPALQRIAAAQGVDETAVAIAWLLHHPARIIPVLGTNDMQRIARMQDALRVTLDRQTWFELYSLANGVEVP